MRLHEERFLLFHSAAQSLSFRRSHHSHELHLYEPRVHRPEHGRELVGVAPWHPSSLPDGSIWVVMEPLPLHVGQGRMAGSPSWGSTRPPRVEAAFGGALGAAGGTYVEASGS